MKKKTRMFRLLIGFCLVAAFLLSACSPSPAAPPTSAPAAQPTSGSAAPQTPTAEQRVLKIGADDFYEEVWDVTQATSGVFPHVMHMFDTLVGLDATGKVVPGIINSWEVAPDHLSWTLHLRNDVMFHDGANADGSPEPSRNLTAEDVAFTLARIVAPDAVDKTRWAARIGENPRIEILDKYNLRVYTNGPQSQFIVKLTGVPNLFAVPKAYIEKNGLAWFRSHPIGTGLYKLVRQAKGDYMEYEAVSYKHWSGVVPDFNRVFVYLVPEETTRVSMLKTGALDASPVSMENAIKLEKEGFKTGQGAATAAAVSFIGVFHPQAKGTPLSNIKVRQALSLAINRQEMIDTLFQGHADFPATPRMGWNRPEITDALRSKWQAWVKQNYRYDPAEAKRLLAEAGYANGLSFKFISAPDQSLPAITDLTNVVVQYWDKVGVKATVVPMDSGAFKKIRNTKNSTDLVGNATILASTVDVDSFTPDKLDHYTSDKGAFDLLVGSDLQAEFDGLYKEGMGYTDPARLEQIIDRMVDVTTSTWISLPLLQTPAMFAFGPRVKGYTTPVTQNMSALYAYWKYTGVEKK